MVHDREPSLTQTSVSDSDTLQKESEERDLCIPDLERQRVMANLKAAQAERPQQIERMKSRQKEGWEAARKVAKMLKQDFGIERAVLFGSLLYPEHMHEGSD